MSCPTEFGARIVSQEPASARLGRTHVDESTHEVPWHVLHVRSNCEKQVARYLAIHSVENFLPLYMDRVRWSDRTVVTERPLFPGYVFARFLPGLRIAVISAPGVTRSLGDDEQHLVRDEEIDRIRKALVGGYILRPHPHLSVGTRVRVRSGVFEGVEGLVSELRERSIVIFAQEAVRQSFSIELDKHNLEILN
jgi:transcription antitermination factor NusG